MMGMEGFALLMLLGIRVREVPDLAEGNVWLPEDRLLFIDSTLSCADRAELADELLASAAALEFDGGF